MDYTKKEITFMENIRSQYELIDRALNKIQDDHDCHASPEDGCQGCEEIETSKDEAERIKIETDYEEKKDINREFEEARQADLNIDSCQLKEGTWGII